MPIIVGGLQRNEAKFEDAKRRDARFARALAHTALQSAMDLVTLDPEEHFIADRPKMGGCPECPRTNCQHTRAMFGSTANSKRQVSMHAFLKLHLGYDFPVTDVMLKKWKCLRSCQYGIRGSGAAMVKDRVCVNPHHYHVQPKPHLEAQLYRTVLDEARAVGFTILVDGDSGSDAFYHGRFSELCHVLKTRGAEFIQASLAPMAPSPLLQASPSSTQSYPDAATSPPGPKRHNRSRAHDPLHHHQNTGPLSPDAFSPYSPASTSPDSPVASHVVPNDPSRDTLANFLPHCVAVFPDSPDSFSNTASPAAHAQAGIALMSTLNINQQGQVDDPEELFEAIAMGFMPSPPPAVNPRMEGPGDNAPDIDGSTLEAITEKFWWIDCPCCGQGQAVLDFHRLCMNCGQPLPREGADIAYLFPKLRTNEALEEGDVVGLFPSTGGHLVLEKLRKTNIAGAVLCGVISRSAHTIANHGAVAGRSPAHIDIVCMYGIVTTKVVGTAKAGDLLYTAPYTASLEDEGQQFRLLSLEQEGPASRSLSASSESTSPGDWRGAFDDEDDDDEDDDDDEEEEEGEEEEEEDFVMIDVKSSSQEGHYTVSYSSVTGRSSSTSSAADTAHGSSRRTSATRTRTETTAAAVNTTSSSASETAKSLLSVSTSAPVVAARAESSSVSSPAGVDGSQEQRPGAWPAGVAQATTSPQQSQILLGRAIAPSNPQVVEVRNGVEVRSVRALISLNNNVTDAAVKQQIDRLRLHVEAKLFAVERRVQVNTDEIDDLKQQVEQLRLDITQATTGQRPGRPPQEGGHRRGRRGCGRGHGRGRWRQLMQDLATVISWEELVAASEPLTQDRLPRSVWREFEGSADAITVVGPCRLRSVTSRAFLGNNRTEGIVADFHRPRRPTSISVLLKPDKKQACILLRSKFALRLGASESWTAGPVCAPLPWLNLSFTVDGHVTLSSGDRLLCSGPHGLLSARTAALVDDRCIHLFELKRLGHENRESAIALAPDTAEPAKRSTPDSDAAHGLPATTAPMLILGEGIARALKRFSDDASAIVCSLQQLQELQCACGNINLQGKEKERKILPLDTVPPSFLACFGRVYNQATLRPLRVSTINGRSDAGAGGGVFGRIFIHHTPDNRLILCHSGKCLGIDPSSGEVDTIEHTTAKAATTPSSAPSSSPVVCRFEAERVAADKPWQRLRIGEWYLCAKTRNRALHTTKTADEPGTNFCINVSLHLRRQGVTLPHRRSY